MQLCTDILYSTDSSSFKLLNMCFCFQGSCANNFGLGGLSEWYATFLLRYTNASIDTAGLLVGSITIIAGISGTVLGSKVADYYLTRVKSSYFLGPALFTIPAGLLLMLAINITDSLWLEVLLLLFAQICAWTCIAPISAVSISVSEKTQRTKFERVVSSLVIKALRVLLCNFLIASSPLLFSCVCLFSCSYA